MPPKRLPDKVYYRIGEISRYTGLEPYVLRYWETEFEQLAPQKSGSRQRLYRRLDVDLILHIKELLYEQGYTIGGARLRLVGEAGRSETTLSHQIIRQVRQELEDVLQLLRR